MTPCITLLTEASRHSNIYFVSYNKHRVGERYNYLYRLYEEYGYPHFLT